MPAERGLLSVLGVGAGAGHGLADGETAEQGVRGAEPPRRLDGVGARLEQRGQPVRVGDAARSASRRAAAISAALAGTTDVAS